MKKTSKKKMEKIIIDYLNGKKDYTIWMIVTHVSIKEDGKVSVRDFLRKEINDGYKAIKIASSLKYIKSFEMIADEFEKDNYSIWFFYSNKKDNIENWTHYRLMIVKW